jgi:hypothetical protein
VCDRVTVAHDTLVGGCQEDGAEEPSPSARRRKVRGCFVFVHPGFQGIGRFRYRHRGIGRDPPVALQGVEIEDVA